MDLVQKAGMELYPAQEEAILELFDGHHVILNTPTGSGKSMVALALHFQSPGPWPTIRLHLSHQGFGQ